MDSDEAAGHSPVSAWDDHWGGQSGPGPSTRRRGQEKRAKPSPGLNPTWTERGAGRGQGSHRAGLRAQGPCSPRRMGAGGDVCAAWTRGPGSEFRGPAVSPRTSSRRKAEPPSHCRIVGSLEQPGHFGGSVQAPGLCRWPQMHLAMGHFFLEYFTNF